MDTDALAELIDTTKKPHIYRTSNLNYYGKWMVDFYPETLPTIGAFNSPEEAHAAILSLVGAETTRRWFSLHPFFVQTELDAEH